MMNWRHGLLLLVLAGLAGCDARKAGAVRWTAAGRAMGSSWSLVVMGNEQRRDECRELVEATLEQNATRFSNWRPDSELSRINDGELTIAEASDSFRELLALAQGLREASGGAFDERLGRAVRTAGFAPSRPVAPAGEQRAELDLCGIAKGFAVDQVCRGLRRLDCDNFVFEHGGEVRAVGGGPEGGGWRVGVEAPEPGERRVVTVVLLSNQAMATSGNYRQFLPADDGELISHVIDPRSDYPVVRPPGSVTVIAGDCAIADGWATALFVIGPGKQAASLAENNGLRVMWDGRE